jgi:peptide-methionine (S)-S-oxide reductase
MNDKLETAVFGGGCFWCVEAIFQNLRGVESVVSGYAGGEMGNPDYEHVSMGTTGHAEVVKVEFDPGVISYEILLNVFFSTHDPTTLNKQGADVGTQYRSVILYTTEEQKNLAESFIKKLMDSGEYEKPIVTEVKALEKFYSAEGYHQNYYESNKNQPYCQVVIDPKVKKFREKFREYLKANDSTVA